ncbi:MAG: PfkB family carbohydrate kinase [Bacillus subtilis]|nr:PfkB family carbohydrate kinase [Bacillus subtilis]
MDRILVVGATVVDISGVGAGLVRPGDSNPGVVGLSVGGVAKNIAENLTRLGLDVQLLTFFGNDLFSGLIKSHLEQAGVRCPMSVSLPGPSGKYVAIHAHDGVLTAAVNDFRVMEALEPADFDRFAAYIEGFDILVLDANLPASVLDHLTSAYRHKRIVVDGVSRAKVVRIRPFLDRIWLLKVNRGELSELLGHDAVDIIYGVKDLVALGIRTVVVTNGADPITYNIDRRIYQTAIFETKNPVSSSGCGDALVAGTVYGLVKGLSMHEAVNCGKKAASYTMEVAEPCHPLLNPKIVED